MKKITGLVIVLAISLFMIRSLFISGYFPMHDDTQVARVVEMGRALRAGQFPVRWVSELGYGYGYPIFNFYGPLPYYLGGTLYALGVTGLTATKIMMGAGLILAGITMYAAIANISGVSAGIVAAVLYMFAPYHAVQAFVRGAVGEYYALIFLPLILWGFVKRRTLLLAAGIAGLVLSHTILGYVGVFFIGIGALLKKKMWTGVFLGLGLAAFFWLPALAEMKYTNVAGQVNSGSDFRDHFVCIGQLWNSAWGFGGSAKGCLDGLSFKVGKMHLLTALLVVIAYGADLFREKKVKTIAAAGFAVFVLSVFFMLDISKPVWNIVPFFAYIQYPWRFLAFAIFGISLVAGQAAYIFRPAFVRWALVLVIGAVVIFVEAKRFTPQYIYSRATSDFESAEDIRFRVSRISDEYLPAVVPRPVKPEDVVRDTIPQSDLYTMEIQQMTDTYKKFKFIAKSPASVQINTAYFPGWQYIVNVTDTKPVVVNGLPVITIPSGDSVIQMRFRDTPVRKAANIISLLSLGICFSIYDKRKKTIS